MSENNLWRKFEAVFKPVFLVITFLVVFFGMAYCTEADAETQVEVGPTFLSGEFAKGGMLGFSERWDKYMLGMGYVSEQEVTDRSGTFYDVRENLFVHGQRLVRYKNLELGLGVAYFNATNRALGSNFCASLSVQYEIGDFGLVFRHFSNAGSARPNMGQDALLVNWRF